MVFFHLSINICNGLTSEIETHFVALRFADCAGNGQSEFSADRATWPVNQVHSAVQGEGTAHFVAPFRQSGVDLAHFVLLPLTTFHLAKDESADFAGV